MSQILTENTIIQPSEVIDGGVLSSSPLPTSFDPALIAPHVKDAESRWVVPVLCQAQYDAMVSEGGQIISNYNTDCGPLSIKFATTAVYETFWTACLRQYIAWAVVFEALPFIGIQIANGGIFQGSSAFSENAGVSGLKWLATEYEDRLDRKKKDILKYLCTNSGDFPLWADCHCSDCGCETYSLTQGLCDPCAEKCGSGVVNNIRKKWGVITY